MRKGGFVCERRKGEVLGGCLCSAAFPLRFRFDLALHV